jgi:hypothetical protein
MTKLPMPGSAVCPVIKTIIFAEKVIFAEVGKIRAAVICCHHPNEV